MAKHRHLNLVQNEQAELAKAFGPSQPRYKLTPELWQHMEMLFKSQKDLCVVLKTTAKTWRDLKSDEGVREATAQHIVIEFISLLRETAAGTVAVSDKIHGQLVAAQDALYAPYLSSMQFSKLYLPAKPPANQTSAPSDANS